MRAKNFHETLRREIERFFTEREMLAKDNPALFKRDQPTGEWWFEFFGFFKRKAARTRKAQP